MKLYIYSILCFLSHSVQFFNEIGVTMSRDDIVLNFTSNPDDGEDTADIDEFLDVSIEKADRV